MNINISNLFTSFKALVAYFCLINMKPKFIGSQVSSIGPF